MSAASGEQVPDAVAHDHGVGDIGAQPLRRSEKQIGIRFRAAHLVSRNHWHALAIDAESSQGRLCRLHPTTCRDRPGHVSFGQIAQEYARAGQRPNLV
jgi:hypothetical protein